MLHKNCFLLFFLSSISLFGQNPKDIIENYLDAVGGIKKWKSIKTLRIDSKSLFKSNQPETIFTIKDDEYSTNVKLVKFHPYRGKMSSYKNDALQFEVYMDDQSHTIVRADNLLPPHVMEVKSKDITPLDLFAKLSEDKDIVYVGEKMFNGELYDVLEIYLGRSIPENYYFNKETSLLEYSFSIADTEIYGVYKDYRKVGEVLFPFYTARYNGDTMFFEHIIDKIQLNIQIDNKDIEQFQ